MNCKVQEVVSFSARAGEIMLQNGAELYRVQDTMVMLCEAYGYPGLCAYIITNGIFCCIGEGTEQVAVDIRSIPISPVHLGRVSAVNELSRRIVREPIPLDEARAELERIAEMPYKQLRVQTILAGIGSGGFCFLLGGSVTESLLALFSGMLLQFFAGGLKRMNASKVIINIAGSAGVTLLALLYGRAGFVSDLSHVIIGSIMPLVPGVALTSGIRDFFNGDYVSGMIRLTDACLVAFCVAVGVGGVLKIFM